MVFASPARTSNVLLRTSSELKRFRTAEVEYILIETQGGQVLMTEESHVEAFEHLASELHSAWTRRGRDESVFPQLAASALERFATASPVRPDDLFHWVAATDQIPRQFDPRSTFGDFSVTVASREDFYIDVLVWTDSSTAVHQHSFSGAFHVLHGSSLHTLWSFEETGRWSDRLKSGQLTVRGTEWLQAGSTRPILPGPAMIHSLFHLESPSVTVVVRTPSAAVHSPQLCYQRSGLAYDERIELARVGKVRQLLRLLWASEHPRRMALSEAALSGVDAHSAVRIILSMRAQTPAGTQACLIDLFGVREPELAKMLRETVSRSERDRSLLDLRKQTQSPRHRMLLALVLNLPDRHSVDSVLRQVAPGESPESWLWETIRSMHETPGRGRDGRSVLGVSLNEVSEEVLKMMLHGESVDEVSRIIAGDDELVEDARALCSTLSALPVLSPLLAQQVTLARHVNSKS